MIRILLCMIALVVSTSQTATAGAIAISSPNPAVSDIGARIRWGGSGFEASLFDSNPFGQSPTLNPGGSPVWQVGQPYAFQVQYSSATGTVTLSIDFNGDTNFGVGESISRSTFAAPGLTDYTGVGFGYLQITGNESGSTGRSTISDLVINGTSFGDLEPDGGFLQEFYTDSSTGLFMDLDVTGTITFNTAGTAQERPTWNFVLGNAGVPSPIPEPTTLVIFGTVVGAGLLYRRRKAATTA